jgi:hypothetical protein
MILTNRYQADEAIVAAVANDSYKGGGDISITGLTRPPQMRVLEKRHWNDLAEDVSDRLASLRGQVTHGILERAGIKNEWSEKRIYAEVLGWKVSGQPDKFESIGVKDGTLIDYKAPTLSSFLFGFQRDKGLKPEWIAQGNAYRWLLHKNGVEVNKIIFKVILLEWSKRHAKVKKDYPSAPFLNYEVPVWTLEQTEAWVTERVKLHQADSFPPCSPEERWEQPAKFAVKKHGRKNAVRGGVHDSEANASEMAASLGEGHYIESRPGEAVRCEDYCRVKAFCPQYKSTIPEGVEVAI